MNAATGEERGASTAHVIRAIGVYQLGYNSEPRVARQDLRNELKCGSNGGLEVECRHHEVEGGDNDTVEGNPKGATSSDWMIDEDWSMLSDVIWWNGTGS